MYYDEFDPEDPPYLEDEQEDIPLEMRTVSEYMGRGKPFLTWERKTPNNQHWFVACGAIEWGVLRARTDAQIVIPAEMVGRLTDAEIGHYVRRLKSDAFALYALSLAEDLLKYRKEIFRNYRAHLNHAVDARNYIIQFAKYPEVDPSGSIKKAVDLVEDLLTHVERKEKGKTTQRYERAAAAKDFDALFVAVGRRDGFKCAACGSTDNLQLDHIEAVTMGGETHPRNLQLLCQPCNLRKGERTIDYRGTQRSEEIQ